MTANKMAIKTNKQFTVEQAFPFLKPSQDVGEYIPGMTLRDYFAAKAMQVILANDETMFEEDAESAYLVADKMMEARK